MKVSDPTLLAAFRCYRRAAKTLRSGRLLIAGDAAHIHSPAGGQGMNTGLHDAFNLGWKLALVAQRRAPAALLDTYQAERVPVAEGVLALTHGLVRTFSMTSPRQRWLRDRVLPSVLAIPAAERRYVTRLAQLSHNYRGGPLTQAAARAGRNHIAPGDRLPSVAGLEFDGKPVSTLDLLGSPGAHAVCPDRRDPRARRRATVPGEVRAIGRPAASGNHHRARGELSGRRRDRPRPERPPPLPRAARPAAARSPRRLPRLPGATHSPGHPRPLPAPPHRGRCWRPLSGRPGATTSRPSTVVTACASRDATVPRGRHH